MTTETDAPMKRPRAGWRTLPWWIVILLIGIGVYWIVDALLCIGLARFGAGSACSSLDAVTAVYRGLMKWAKYRRDELQALSAVTICVLLLLLVIGVYRLGRHAVQLVRMQGRNTEAALAAARHAAETAARAAEATRAVFVAHERPWVQVLAADPAADLVLDDVGAGVPIDIRLRNVGRSPAIDVRVHVELRSTEGSLDIPVDEPQALPAGPTLFPAQEAALRQRVLPPAALRDEMRQRFGGDGAAVARDLPPPMYLVGAAFYDTALEGSRRRTEFCFELCHREASPPASAGGARPASPAARVPAAEPMAAGPRVAT